MINHYRKREVKCQRCCLSPDLSSLTLEDIDSVSEANTKQDALGPLPPPAWTNTYNTNPYGPSYMPPPPMNYMAPYNYNDSASYVSVPGAGNGAESMHSGSGKG